jgi:hypothetical protein
MTTAQSSDVFAGHYRLAVKTAIFRDANGQIAPAEQVADIPTLLRSLPPDAEMRKEYPGLTIPANASDEMKLAATPVRVDVEQKNVTIPAWLWYVKKEKDNDYHVILGSSAGPDAVYMNVEVSGLPVAADDPNFTDLQNARKQLTSLLGHEPSATDYEQPFNPPLPVSVTGSLLYDGDHVPGEVGPVGHQPQTTWEIHPVTSIGQRQ